MKCKLFLQAMFKFIVGLIIVGLLLFVPAGTIHFFNGWLFLILLFFPMFIFGIILLFKNPEILKNRLNAKEKEVTQKAVIFLSGLMFIIAFILAGLNYRYDWLKLPNKIVILPSIIFIISYILYAKVIKDNPFLYRTIEVKENQKVIDTGFYGIVRHPMYLITIFLFLSMPLILGSLYSFIICLIYPIIIIKRINNEEKVLSQELKGYRNYMKKVKYKLIPFIW